MTLEKIIPLSKGFLIMFMAVIFAVAPAATGQGAERENTDVPRHYPQEFDGKGCIDDIRENEVVIDDSLYPIAPYAIFHTPRYADISRDIFVPGKIVVYVLNDKGEIECMCLWDEDEMNPEE